jgi:hypothetical protein
MASVEARCTQCGSKEFGSAENNSNKYDYRVYSHELRHGTGREHGVELLECPTCDEETVHNRCGKSAPSSGR